MTPEINVKPSINPFRRPVLRGEHFAVPIHFRAQPHRPGRGDGNALTRLDARCRYPLGAFPAAKRTDAIARNDGVGE